jgi:DNA recombination protein RmuC
MDNLFIIIALMAGLVAGIIIGFIIRRLISEKNAISHGKFEQLQKSYDDTLSDVRFLKSENERLNSVLLAKEEEKRQSQEQVRQMTASIATFQSEAEHAVIKAKESDLRTSVSDQKFENIQKEFNELQRQNSEITAKLNGAEKRIEEFVEETNSLKESLRTEAEEMLKTKSQLTSVQEQNKNFLEKLETQKKEIEDIGQKFAKEFQILADNIFEQNSKKFTEQNQVNMKSILEPLGKNIEEFKKKVEETYDKESKERFSLADRVKELAELNKKISEEANNLTQALKGSVKQQGNWGEMILESILQNSGLRKGFEYQVQSFIRDDSGETIKDDEGKKLQPDVIVSLPDDRQIVIDSKVSLIAYERYVSSDDASQQALALVEHVKSLRAHIDGLSAKSYQSHVKSLDFVMLFVPVEPAYMIAMQHDVALWEYAYKKRILLISPTNLIAALKLVADLWQRELQNRNALLIAERGAQLYDKFVTFAESLDDLGKKLDGAQKSYGNAMSQLSTGRGNLVRQVEMLKELGVKAQKAIPSSLKEDMDEEDS